MPVFCAYFKTKMAAEKINTQAHYVSIHFQLTRLITHQFLEIYSTPAINIYHKGCGTLGVPVFASENIELTLRFVVFVHFLPWHE